MRTWPVLALVVACAVALILGISHQAAKASKQPVPTLTEQAER